MTEAKKLARYTLGFIFNYRLGHGGVRAPPTEVLLIQKAKPAWQHGRLNGLGGKLEPGETPAQCISREVEEESRRPGAAPGERGILDAAPEYWMQFGVLRGAEVYHHEASASFEIHLFATFADDRLLLEAEAATSSSKEPLRIISLQQLLLDFDTKALPNVRWMVNMALSFHHGEAAECFDVREMKLATLMGESEVRAAEADVLTARKASERAAQQRRDAIEEDEQERAEAERAEGEALLALERAGKRLFRARSLLQETRVSSGGRLPTWIEDSKAYAGEQIYPVLDREEEKEDIHSARSAAKAEG